jgi:hypothetical protein
MEFSGNENPGGGVARLFAFVALLAFATGAGFFAASSYPEFVRPFAFGTQKAVQEVAPVTFPATAGLVRFPLRSITNRLASGDGNPGYLFWLSSKFKAGDPKLLDVVGVGDVMMGSRDVELNPRIRPDSDVPLLVGPDLWSTFHRADIAFANLEGPLYDGDAPPAKTCERCFEFRSPTYYARILAGLGVDVVSLANNHAGDYGEAGKQATVDALRSNRIAFCGLDADGARSADFTVRSFGRVAVVAFAPDNGLLDLLDLRSASRIIHALKKDHAVVVVAFHGGGEGAARTHVTGQEEFFDGEDRGNVLAFAHRAIDAGADIVLGQGPHVVRAVEIYRGRLIAYSLGNFWTYRGIDTSSDIDGAGPVLEAWLAPGGELAGFTIHAIEQRSHGVPRLDGSHAARRIILTLTKSDFPATYALLARSAVPQDVDALRHAQCQQRAGCPS